MDKVTKNQSKKKEKSLSYFKKKAWEAFSIFIRQRGADIHGFNYCYTCGGIDKWDKLQAGHAIQGRNNAVLLDESICRPQCVSCNIFRHGMQHIFCTKLIVENGMDWWAQKLAESKQIKKVSRLDYERLIEEFKNFRYSKP